MGWKCWNQQPDKPFPISQETVSLSPTCEPRKKPWLVGLYWRLLFTAQFFIGITIHHCKDAYYITSISWKSFPHVFLFSWLTRWILKNLLKKTRQFKSEISVKHQYRENVLVSTRSNWCKPKNVAPRSIRCRHFGIEGGSKTRDHSKWPILWGIKQCKCIVNLRDFPLIVHEVWFKVMIFHDPWDLPMNSKI